MGTLTISHESDLFFLLLHCPIIVLLSVSNVVLEFVVKIKQKNRQLLRCKEKNISNGEIHIRHSKILTPWRGAGPKRLYNRNLALLCAHDGLFTPTLLLVHKPNCDQAD